MVSVLTIVVAAHVLGKITLTGRHWRKSFKDIRRTPISRHFV